MLQAFIVTLREGVEAALAVAITLAYLQKSGRQQLERIVYWALGAACLASMAVAFLISKTAYNQEVVEGWVMLAAAFFVIGMVVFMARNARGLKGRIEERLGALAGKRETLGLFLFVFLMVFREGVETVLILSAVTLNSTELMSFFGTVAGVGCAVLFGVLFVKGSLRINLSKFFRITSVILSFVAAQLLVTGLHELSENGILPSSRREMAIVGPIVSNDLFFFVTILALAALMILFEQRRRSGEPSPAMSGAARRKAEWSARRERLWMSSVYICSFVFIALVTAQFIYTKSASAEEPSEPVALQGGAAHLSVADLGPGDLHRYRAAIGNQDVRFLLYRKADGQVVATFDACVICGSKGYQKTASGLVCKNCGAPVNVQAIGQSGGCNPIPLKVAISGTNATIAESDLQAGQEYFRK